MSAKVLSGQQVVTTSAPTVKVGGFVDGFRRWLAYRDTVRALRRLSPRELADIGVDTSVEDFAERVVDGNTGR